MNNKLRGVTVMKKFFILLIAIIFSSASLASSSELQSLFKSSQNNSATVLSQKEMSEVKGGARSPVYTCSVCGAKHGGVYSPNVCHNCYNKGFRINGIRRP
nr:hemocin structural protein [Avibacterium paragallinarum]